MEEYEAALKWLNNLASETAFFKKGVMPSLGEVRKALEALNRPDKSFVTRVIVGGTAGKGTVCRYVEQTLLAEGRSVAVLSSPHIQVVNERIRLNGKLVSMMDFTMSIQVIKDLMINLDLKLTYYEVIVLTGIYLAAKKEIEILICEVGLGGEFDGVNAIQGERVSALTFIGDDHREILGPKLENIAKTKAGIFIEDSVLNLSYEQKYSSILEKKSNHKVVFIKGIKQKLNKKIARKICEQILESKELIMTTTPLPCRWEKVTDKITLDGAHSAPRFEYLKQTNLKKNPGPYTLVLGMQKNHNPEAFELLKPYAARTIFTQSGLEGFLEAEEIKKVYGAGEVVKKASAALRKAQEYNEPVLVIGSFYLCGALRESFYSSDKILEQQTEWPR